VAESSWRPRLDLVIRVKRYIVLGESMVCAHERGNANILSIVIGRCVIMTNNLHRCSLSTRGHDHSFLHAYRRSLVPMLAQERSLRSHVLFVFRSVHDPQPQQWNTRVAIVRVAFSGASALGRVYVVTREMPVNEPP
jgi:hypothetical protein